MLTFLRILGYLAVGISKHIDMTIKQKSNETYVYFTLKTANC